MGFFGSIMALPAMVFFFATWLVASLFRPLLLCTIICMASNPAAAKEKLGLFLTTFQFMAFSKDKKWKKPADPALAFGDYEKDETIERKTVVFIRHGESTWNDTFNKGDRKMGEFLIGFLPGLFRAFFSEWYFMLSGKATESWFFDSPLSQKGISQAKGLQKYLKETDPQFATPKEAEILHILNGTSEEKSQLTTSNLRRAMSTIAIGLQARLDKDEDDKIIVLTELQEASINPDALSISPAKKPVVSSWMDSARVKDIYAHQMDPSKNNGNKSLKGNGLERLQGFTKMVFDDFDAPNVVATGHSYWFRAFFQTYLPFSVEHVSKKKKLCNGGVAGFTLMRKKTKTGDVYMIDPASIVVLYGGF